MRILFRLLVGCLVLILMSSCTGYRHFVAHKQAEKACHLNCMQQFKQCDHMCRNNKRNCTALSQAQAAVHFNQYKHQRCVQGEIVALELQSFRDPLQCRKATCACRTDYDVCLQACNHKIRKNYQGIDYLN